MMKKAIALLLALTILFAAGCSKKEEQPAPTVTEATAAPETTVPETTPPETEPPKPKLEPGTVQGSNVPGVLALLRRGDQVEVTGYTDETHATVKTDLGTGTLETWLLRFAGEAQPESWTGYARWNTGFYSDYDLAGTAPATLKTNTKVEVLEDLQDCYLVSVNEETGYVAKKQISKWPIGSGAVSSDSGSSGSGSGGSSGGSSSGGSATGQDGGDIQMAVFGRLHLLADEVKTGSAQVLADNARLVYRYYQPGETVLLVAEEGFAPELPGYVTILEEDTYVYLPEAWVHRDADPAFESWDGFAGINCYLYDNIQLKGQPVKHVYGNTAIRVLWTAGEVSLIQAGELTGYASTETLRTTRLPVQQPQEGGGGGGGGSSGGGSSAPEWTPAAL